MSDTRPIRLHARIRLADGSLFKLCPLDPGDRHYFCEEWDGLSEQSRYSRFLAPKPALSASDLTFLTGVDQNRHVAVGALDLGPAVPRPAAVGRYVRLGPQDREAELAITVLDAYQDRGLGSALFDFLKADACAHGVRQFRACILRDNRPMERLIRKWGGRVVEMGHQVAETVIPLTPAL